MGVETLGLTAVTHDQNLLFICNFNIRPSFAGDEGERGERDENNRSRHLRSLTDSEA